MSDTVSKILLATDGSEGSRAATRFAATIAKGLGAAVTIVTVHDEDPLLISAIGPAAWPASVPIGSIDLEDLKAPTEQRARETYLKDTQDTLGNSVTVDVVQLWGHAAESICTYAEEEKFDLIIMGSRGHTAFKRLLLGSTSTQVAHHAPCPITIVP